jgi:hypothetical protein
MKKVPVIIGVSLAAVAFAVLWHATHGISVFARTDCGDSSKNTHSDEEIRMAASIVREQFRKEFNGCIMTELSYSEEWSQAEMEYENSYYACYLAPEKCVDDAIVLESTFVTKSPFASFMWENYTQRGWKWVIKHTPEGGWKFTGCGYA